MRNYEVFFLRTGPMIIKAENFSFKDDKVVFTVGTRNIAIFRTEHVVGLVDRGSARG